MDAEVLTAIRQHAQDEYPKECCGIVIDTGQRRLKAIRCVNQYPDIPLDEISSKNPVRSARKDFQIDPIEEHLALKQGKIVAIYHSHPNGVARFTPEDILASEETGYPYIVVEHPGPGWATYAPKGFVCELVRRPFIYGIYDCYTLVRDWHRLKHGIVFPPGHGKDYGWWMEGENDAFYLNTLKELGFRVVPDLRPGNVLLMTYRTKVPNHLAIFEGDGYMLHHLSGRPSELTIYGGQWELNTRVILRHKEMP